MGKKAENILFTTLWVIFIFLWMFFLYDAGHGDISPVNEFINLGNGGKPVHVEGGENIPNMNFFTANVPKGKVIRPYFALNNVEVSALRINGNPYDFLPLLEEVPIGSDVWKFIPLPEDMDGGEVSFTLKDDIRLSGKTPKIYFGTRNFLLGNLAVPPSIYLVLGAVILVLGIASLFVDAILRMYKINWHFSFLGLTVIFFSVWILSLSSVSVDFLDGMSTDFVQCTTLFITPALLFRFISVAFKRITGRYFVFLSAFHILLVILAGYLILADKVHFYQIEQIMWFIYISSLLQCICRLGVDIAKFREVRSLYICITIMFFTYFGYLLFCNFRPTTALRCLIMGTSAILCYGIFIFIRSAVELYREALERRNIEKVAGEQLKMYKVLESKNNEFRKMRHDLKNHWQVLSSLIYNGENEKALDYINELQSELSYSTSANFVISGNPFLDAVLTSKFEYAANNGIKVDSEIMVVKDIKMNPADNSIIFGNLLDNAIEGCKFAEGEKFIHVKMMYKNHMLICRFTNSANEQLIKKDLKTSKSDSENHGIGLNNIREAVEKYDGKLNIRIEDGKFEAAFVLMNV